MHYKMVNCFSYFSFEFLNFTMPKFLFLIKDMFHVHFEKNLESKLIEKLKENLNDRSKISQLEETVQVKINNYFIL